jgi:hypothetical protein
MQLRRKRSSHGRHRAKQAAIAVGATVLAAEGVRRLRNRKDEEHSEQ